METARKGTKKSIWIALGVVLALLAAAVVGGCAYVTSRESFFPNTTIFGVDVDGMTRVQATRALRSRLDEGARGVVTFTLEDEGEVMRFPLSSIGLSVDCTAEVEKAYAASSARSGFFENGLRYLEALRTPTAYGTERYRDVFTAAAKPVLDALTVAPIDFDASLRDNGLLLTCAKDGRRPTENAEGTIAEALCAAYFDPARAKAPVKLREGSAGEYECLPAKRGDLAALHDGMVGEMVNAAFDVESESITPDHTGVAFSLASLETAVQGAVPGSTFLFPVEITPPEVTAEALEECLFRDILGTYTTRVSGTTGRRANVRLSAESCNGVVLNSGDIFNYNETTGDRTAERGYQPAPGYLAGKTVDMIGGGICQTSSTIYAAALYANLEIVQRTNHGFASDYIGLGLDATVSGGGPEFEFRNDTPYPIRIETIYDDTHHLTVNLWGTKTDDTYVVMTTEVLSTTPFVEWVEETDELPPGERKVVQTAYTGYDVKTYRNVYQGDGTLLSTTFEARSRYKKRDRVIHVGKAPAQDAAAPVQPGISDDPSPAQQYPSLPPVPEFDPNLALTGW